ncbi:hypothetical protein NA57DRAFT_81906 [Rhizodiscina lignyota]|uniref:DUF6697 domain-containing protein n=1 Tax=Rhizodiscina lignyota TaxID=1504668 RepID=A0A9P4M2Y6_9PEZI|nr:hypothetical protein NA57DRAFT_81906 [Rhizodiscina lignyota]
MASSNPPCDDFEFATILDDVYGDDLSAMLLESQMEGLHLASGGDGRLGEDTSTVLPESRMDGFVRRPREAIQEPKTEVEDHGNQRQPTRYPAFQGLDLYDLDADSKYLYSEDFAQVRTSFGQPEKKPRVLLAMPENALFGPMPMDDQANHNVRCPVGIRRLDKPPGVETVGALPSEHSFYIEGLRELWTERGPPRGTGRTRYLKPQVPGIWWPKGEFSTRLPPFAIIHSKVESWSPSHPTILPSHGAFLEMSREGQRTEFPSERIALLVEKASCIYEYYGHYRIFVRDEERLSRSDIDAEVAPHHREFLSWKIFKYRYQREEYDGAIREAIVSRRLAAAQRANPRDVPWEDELYLRLSENDIKDEFFKDKSDTPLGFRLRWVYLEFVEYDNDFSTVLTRAIEDSIVANGAAKRAKKRAAERAATAGAWKLCRKGGYCSADCAHCKDAPPSNNAQASSGSVIPAVNT